MRNTMGAASPRNRGLPGSAIWRSIIAVPLLTLLSGPAWALPDAELEHVAAGREARRTAMLLAQIDRPFPNTACRSDAFGDPCLLGQLNAALAMLYLGRSTDQVAEANQLLVQSLVRLQGPEWKRGFHGVLAGLLFRIVGLFGTAGIRTAGSLDAMTERAIAGVFNDWASSTCTLAEARRTEVWRIWGSENHGAQRDGTCWAAAVLAQRDPALQSRPYADGSRAAEQTDAWTDYLRSYFRERGRRGALAEYFSPTYAQYTLSPFYNYVDFSPDPELLRLARSYLDLWWATWAQEQVGGSHGGSKARVYFNPRVIAAGSPMVRSAYLYTGLGIRSAVLPPGEAPAITSRYAPPMVVLDLALDTVGRGTFDIFTRAPGLARVPFSNDWYDLRADFGGVLRVSRVTPGYVLGTAMVPKLFGRAWSAVGCQNRWSGVVLASNPEERVAVVPGSPPGRSNCNAFWSVQSGATMIAQRLAPPFGLNVLQMRLWVGRGLRREERDDWLFLEGGSAFIAIRPVWGGYGWDPEEPRVMVPNDSDAPVIVQVAAKPEFNDFAAFQRAVLAAPLREREGVLTFTGLGDAGTLTFHARSNELPEINGRVIDLAPPFAIRSPFIHQAWDSGVITIEKDGRRHALSFD